MYAHAHVHMHARMHASPYGSQVCKSHQFDPQMWGGPYPSLKMVSLRSSLCSFSVRNRTGGKPKEIAEVCISRQGTRNGRSICVCAQASLVNVHVCAHLCVYFSAEYAHPLHTSGLSYGYHGAGAFHVWLALRGRTPGPGDAQPCVRR